MCHGTAKVTKTWTNSKFDQGGCLCQEDSSGECGGGRRRRRPGGSFESASQPARRARQTTVYDAGSESEEGTRRSGPQATAVVALSRARVALRLGGLALGYDNAVAQARGDAIRNHDGSLRPGGAGLGEWRGG